MTLSESDILSSFDKLDSNSKKIVEKLFSAQKEQDTSEYIYGKLSFSKNQHGFSWKAVADIDGKKRTYSVSTKSVADLTESQVQFIENYGSRDAKYLIRSNKGYNYIIELWLKDESGSYISVDSDIMKYKFGTSIRNSNGFCGNTFVPVSSTKNEWLPEAPGGLSSFVDDAKLVSPRPVSKGGSDSNATMDDIKSLLTGIEENDKIVNEEEIVADSGLSKQEKMNNTKEFLQDMDTQLFDIFKEFENREVNVQNNKHIRFSMLIEEGSNEHVVHVDAVQRRNHGGTKLDAVDGEAMFSYLMNPIFKRLGYNTRFKIDGRCFEKMGDNGDFTYGTQRLDIKTRQKKNPKYRHNLLVNENVMQKGFNEFALVLREGDPTLSGKQRRLTLVGTATAEKVMSKPAKFINGGRKYEVEIPDLESLRVLISRVLVEVLEKEES